MQIQTDHVFYSCLHVLISLFVSPLVCSLACLLVTSSLLVFFSVCLFVSLVSVACVCVFLAPSVCWVRTYGVKNRQHTAREPKKKKTGTRAKACFSALLPYLGGTGVSPSISPNLWQQRCPAASAG